MSLYYTSLNKGIFNDPKPSNLVTVPCCNDCNNKHSKFDDQLRAFAAIEIGKNAGGQRILMEKVIGSTMKKGRQKEFFMQVAQTMREVEIATQDGIQKVTVVSVKKAPLHEGAINIVKGLLAHFYPHLDYFKDHFEALDIHNATLGKGHYDEQIQIVTELMAKTPHNFRGANQEFRWWHHVDQGKTAGAWLLMFYESVSFVVIHHPVGYVLPKS